MQVLSCREEVEAELVQQVLLFIDYNRTVGMESVMRFLRPFFMFAVIHKPAFARHLISSVASLACSFPSEATSIIEVLRESLKFFPCTNERVCLVPSLISYICSCLNLHCACVLKTSTG